MFLFLQSMSTPVADETTKDFGNNVVCLIKNMFSSNYFLLCGDSTFKTTLVDKNTDYERITIKLKKKK